MADHTHIEWTEATWNPITGCSVISPGCKRCYAMVLAGTRLKNHPSRAGLTVDTDAGPVWTGEVRLNDEWLTQPLSWRRPRKIFVCAHGDLFHENVPDEWIDRVFAVMALAPQHTFQVLTKRAARMRAYLTAPGRVRAIMTAARNLRYEAAPDPEKNRRAFRRLMDQSARDTAWTVEGGAASDMFQRKEPDRDFPSWVRWPLPNVWLGTSTEDQPRADDRLPELMAAPAAVRFVSVEPMIGPVDVRPWLKDVFGLRLDWVIVGGENGRRPMHPDWARDIRDACAECGVAFFFKQHGTWRVVYDRDVEDPDWRRCGRVEQETPEGRWLNLAGGHGFHGERVVRVTPTTKKVAGRVLDGRTHDEMPEIRA